MVKVYEWSMAEVGGGMNEASEQGWEYVSGPVPYTHEGETFLACLMRREVVPGRVTSPAEPLKQFDPAAHRAFEVNVLLGVGRTEDPPPTTKRAPGTDDGLGEQSDPLRNCLTCRYLSFWGDGGERCDSSRDGEPDMAAWVERTHVAVPGRLGMCCPPNADGCPGWAPKATP